MKYAIIVFPGSNCDEDIYHALVDHAGLEAEFVSHETQDLKTYDGVIVPGGFSYGDYLRAGAIAQSMPVMDAVRHAAKSKKPVIGICNGFQILVEAGLLPGALLENKGLKFTCYTPQLRVENNTSIFSSGYELSEIISIPTANKQGNYYCDDETYQELKAHDQIIFSYVDDVNGSIKNIAGITNEEGNVLGMMPHPERAVEMLLGSKDGLTIFESISQSQGAKT